MLRRGSLFVLSGLLLTSCGLGEGMTRTPVNPTRWSAALGYNQGEVTTGHSEILTIAGQTDLVEDPESPFGVSTGHPGDMKAQIESALAGIDAVLEGAGMSREHLMSVRIFTTDMPTFLQHYGTYVAWVTEKDRMPPMTLVGVSALALPDMLVEIEAVAGR